MPLTGEKKKALVDLLLRVPATSSFAGRTALLGEAESLGLKREESNARLDLTEIVQQLDRLSAYEMLAELMENAIQYVTGTPVAEELEALLCEVRRPSPLSGSLAPPVTTADAEEHFRQAVVRRFERLAVRLPSVAQIELPLEDIYVDLKVVADIPETADTFGPDERRIFSELDSATEAERNEKLRQLDDLRYRRWRQPNGISSSFVQSALDCAARALRPLVILGDPGSGKSTALQLMALRTARDGALDPQAPNPPAGRWLPLHIQLAAYDEHLQETRYQRLTLEDFLAVAWAARRGTADLCILFSEVLRHGRALVLLDGLDEVLTHVRRLHVNDQVKALIDTWSPLGNRFVITSRFVGYREAPLSGVADEVSVVDFGPKDIERFLRNWYEATDGQCCEKRAKSLIDQINRGPRLRNLAANPLMLSMLTALQSKRGDDERLPERRVELYEEFAEMMLAHRPETRSEGARAEAIPRTDSTTMRAHISNLALWLQLNRPSNTATREDIVKALARSHLRYEANDPNQPKPKEELRAEREAKKLFEELREITGLVGERGHNAHGFLHLTYQEFFAAGAVANMPPDERWELLYSRLHDPRWREVVLLCAAHLDKVAVDEFVQRVLAADSEYESILHRNVLLASTIVADEACTSENVLARLHNELVTLLQDDIPTVRDRATNGIVSLARLGLEKSVDLLAEALERELRSDLSNLIAQAHNVVVPLLVLPHCRRLLNIVLLQLEECSGEYSKGSQVALSLQHVVRTDLEVRRRLVKLLLRDDKTADLMGIMSCLSGLVDEDDEVREAVWALTRSKTIGQPAISHLAIHCSSTAELRRLLDNHWSNTADPMIRAALIPALAKVAQTDHESLVELVACAFDRDFNVRIQVAPHIAAMADTKPEAKQAMLKLLANADTYMMGTVIQALPSSVKADTEIRRATAAALCRSFHDVSESELLSMDDAAFYAESQRVLARLLPIRDFLMPREAARSIVEASKQQSGIEAILRHLDDIRSSQPVSGIDALAPMVPVDERVAADIESYLDDPDPFARAAAINALGPLLPYRVQLRQRVLILLEDGTPFVCHAAMKALSAIVDEDQEARMAIVRMTTVADEQKPMAAADALTKAAARPEVRAALLRLLEEGSFSGRMGAARALARLVPRDTEIRDRFRELAADLAAGSVTFQDSSTLMEMLDGVVERDPDVVGFFLPKPRSYHAMILVVRHAAALGLEVDDLDSWPPQLFNAVVRGMISWYDSKPSVRNYVLRSIECATFSEDALGRLVPLVLRDKDLCAELVRRAIKRGGNGASNVEVLSQLIPYVQMCPDIESAFRGLLEQHASEHSEYLCQMLAAAGLSGLTARDPELQTRLLPWLGARIEDHRAVKARQFMAKRFAAVLTPNNVTLRARVMEMLDSSAWQDRQGAAWVLIHSTAEKSPGLLEKLRSLLCDTRAEETWLRRLQVADLVLNHKEIEISRRAVAVAREALGYGNSPWHGPLGDKVRTQAAKVLGKLEPTHRDTALVNLIVVALKEERSREVLNALYNALLHLVAASERPSA